VRFRPTGVSSEKDTSYAQIQLASKGSALAEIPFCAPIKAIEFHATITSKRTLECIGGDLSAKLQQSSGIAHVSQPPELTK